MKTQKLLVIVASVCLLIGHLGAIMARAEPQQKYTGCIYASVGIIVSVAPGDEPSTPCRSDQIEITFPGTDTTDDLQKQIDALTGVLFTDIGVDCDGGDVLQDAIDAAPPNTTILVAGTCEEQIRVDQLKQDLTIDGQGSASITAADASGPMVSIFGRGITIRNFNDAGSINGGERGIVVSDTASATIQNNTIEKAASAGIDVEGNSFATIVGNTVQNNGGNGIAISEGSAARIGGDCEGPFNIISDNGQSGIALSRNAEASIIANTIAGSGTNGIFVTDGSMADTAANTIIGNGGDGIEVRRGSSVRMGRRDPSNPPVCAEFTNRTLDVFLNAGYGIDCQSLSTVDGRLGSLNGISGAANLRNTNADCPNCCFTSLGDL